MVNNKIVKEKIYKFSGGVHPKQFKSSSSAYSIETLPCPPFLVYAIDLKRSRLLVAIGDDVLAGQPLIESLDQQNAYHTVISHAALAGRVVDISVKPSNDWVIKQSLSIVIQTDVSKTEVSKAETLSHESASLSQQIATAYQTETPLQLIERIHQAGVNGLGGAGFPTARKLNNALGKTDFVIINGAECEPFITADDRLMQEYTIELLQGCLIVQYILQPKRMVIAIEDNKPMAILALRKILNEEQNDCYKQSCTIEIQEIPTKYPSGGKKQLTQILTGIVTPVGNSSINFGISMYNVGTVYAIKQAVIDQQPLTKRVVTISGEQIPKPRNYWMFIGTPIDFILQQVQYQACTPERLIIGGPMMGYQLSDLSVPVTKTTNCILAASYQQVPEKLNDPCIRCGRCAEVCPARLQPQQLYWFIKQGNYQQVEKNNLSDCIECGACSYVCPSIIDLVPAYQQAKIVIYEQNEEKNKAEAARIRFELKQQRLEREQFEREQRSQQAALRRKNMQTTMDHSSTDDVEQVNKQSDVVAAAIARIQAKKAQSGLIENVVLNQNEPQNRPQQIEQVPRLTPAQIVAQTKAKQVQEEKSLKDIVAQQEDTVQNGQETNELSSKQESSEKIQLELDHAERQKIKNSHSRSVSNNRKRKKGSPSKLTQSKTQNSQKVIKENSHEL